MPRKHAALNPRTYFASLLQAPVPYLNRAIAEEQLGVNAASAGKIDEAAQHYQAAIQVACLAALGRSTSLSLCERVPCLWLDNVVQPFSCQLDHSRRAWFSFIDEALHPLRKAGHTSKWCVHVQDCRDAQSRDSKEFAAFFNEGNVQVCSHCEPPTASWAPKSLTSNASVWSCNVNMCNIV